MRTSLYADDVVIFINPMREEIDMLLNLLECFNDATGLRANLSKSSAIPIRCNDIDLRANLSKSSAIPIRCNDIDLDSILQNFGGRMVALPITCLGLPIRIVRLTLVHLQFILGGIIARIAGWKGRFMPMAGRHVLVRCVLSSLLTFAITALQAPKNFFQDIDKSRGASARFNGRRSPCERLTVALVSTISRIHARAVARWLWLSWLQPHRPYDGTGTPCDGADRALFAASTGVTIGDGATTSFWFCSYLGDRQLCLAYPTVFAMSIKKNRIVREAMHDDRWILDLRHGNYIGIVHQVIQLAREIRQAGIMMEHGSPDSIKWTLCSSGQYSARSAYMAHFENYQPSNFRELIWKIWVPGKIKMFLWLLHQDRLW
ncbi:hypothetical protein D1007_27263 [Hordeum vulgare]|nr:hypothetical protein D1007_27263 [Hordeum vulgare]